MAAGHGCQWCADAARGRTLRLSQEQWQAQAALVGAKFSEGWQKAGPKPVGRRAGMNAAPW